MDFIERIFGISPDGGSGLLEFLFLVIPVLGLYVLHTARAVRKKRRS